MVVDDLSGTRLLKGQYLCCNEYIVSQQGAYFAIMQGDGNFCVYAGTGPADNRGNLWNAGVYGSAADYVALIQPDGNFVLSHGTIQDRRDNYWSANATNPGKEIQLLLQDDGRLVLAATHLAPRPEQIMWMSDTAQSPGANYTLAAHSDYNRTGIGGPAWCSFVPEISGVLGAIDLFVEPYQAEFQQFDMRLYAGIGLHGEFLGKQVVKTTRQPGFQHPTRYNAEFAFEEPLQSPSVVRPHGPTRVVAGKPYTLEVRIGSREQPRPGPSLGGAEGGWDSSGVRFAHRIYVRPDRPVWAHPVG